MSAEQKLNMALDDIIKTGKKTRTPTAAKSGKKPLKGGRRSVGTSAAGRKAKPGARKTTGKPAAGGKIAQRAQQMRQTRATKAIGQRAAKGNTGNAATTSRLVNRLVKKALLQTGRLNQARRTRTPVAMRAAVKRQTQQPAVGRNRRQPVAQNGRKPVVSNQLRSRLGWTGKPAAAGGRRVGATVAKGRGAVGGKAHMDTEQRQRANRVQTQRRLAQQQRQQATQLQRQQVQQRNQMNARAIIQQQQRQRGQQAPRRGAGARGGGVVGNAANTAQFIRNTVFKAMAEASMGRMAQRPMAMQQPRRVGRAGGLQTRAMQPHEQTGGMRGFNDAPFIQSQPRRQRQQRMAPQQSFFSGQSFDTPQRAAFSVGGPGARTLDERFGGGGRAQQFF